ncbi:MAG: ankyrin repeat domain-containing protein [Ottowia sp.]|nr:ankyrin repeat domain-containing protein [Ottowia sp.]
MKTLQLPLKALLLAASARLAAAAHATPCGSGDLPTAARLGKEKDTRCWLAAGADANAPDAEGRTPLMWYARHGREGMVQQLLQAGAKPDAIDTEGRTALMHAARNGSTEAAQVLLDHRADPNLADAEGNTALMLAAAHGKSGVLSALINSGAHINARNKAGATALDLARKGSNPTVEYMLLRVGATGAPVASAAPPVKTVPSAAARCKGHFTVAARDGDDARVRCWLDAGADPNERDQHGATALMNAAAGGHTGAARLLMERGADPNIATRRDGATALMMAAYRGHADMVRLLLAKGANPNARNDDGQTPLSLALRGRDGNANSAIVQMLRAAGAK